MIVKSSNNVCVWCVCVCVCMRERDREREREREREHNDMFDRLTHTKNCYKHKSERRLEGSISPEKERTKKRLIFISYSLNSNDVNQYFTLLYIDINQYIPTAHLTLNSSSV